MRPGPGAPARAVAALGLAGAAALALACYQPDAFTIDQIALEEVAAFGRGEDAWTAAYHVNRAYTCARGGFHAFVVLSPADAAPGEPRPLWVRLPGGGIGYWSEDGAWVAPEGTFDVMSFQPSWEELVAFTTGTPEPLDDPARFDDAGLLRLVTSSPEGFRVLIPSMCDHDLYGGVGSPDALSPERPEGREPFVDGLLALRAALDHTLIHFPSTHVFAHGTSSGAVGAANLAISLGKEGEALSGAVLDSAVLSELFAQAVEDQACRQDPGALTVVRPGLRRVGLYASASHFPHVAVAAGVVTTPLVDVYSRGDPSSCGQTQVTVTTLQGVTVTGPATELLHAPLDAAIDTHDPGPASHWRKTCIGVDCATHVVTNRELSSLGGDTDHGGEDTNAGLFAWVSERLLDPLPDLVPGRP